MNVTFGKPIFRIVIESYHECRINQIEINNNKTEQQVEREHEVWRPK